MTKKDLNLPKSILKNISKVSEPEFYYKNIKFIENFESLMNNNKLKEIGIIKRKDAFKGPFLDKTLEEIYYAKLKIANNCIPIPIFVGIWFGVNYCPNWSNRKHLRRLGKIYNEMKENFTILN